MLIDFNDIAFFRKLFSVKSSHFINDLRNIYPLFIIIFFCLFNGFVHQWMMMIHARLLSYVALTYSIFHQALSALLKIPIISKILKLFTLFMLSGYLFATVCVESINLSIKINV